MKKTKCQFCKEEHKTEEMFHGHLAMMIPEAKYEDRINELGRDSWWERMKEPNLPEKEAKELEDLALYDQLVNTIGRGSACNKCLEKEDKMYQKYYPNNE